MPPIWDDLMESIISDTRFEEFCGDLKSNLSESFGIKKDEFCGEPWPVNFSECLGVVSMPTLKFFTKPLSYLFNLLTMVNFLYFSWYSICNFSRFYVANLLNSHSWFFAVVGLISYLCWEKRSLRVVIFLRPGALLTFATSKLAFKSITESLFSVTEPVSVTMGVVSDSI